MVFTNSFHNDGLFLNVPNIPENIKGLNAIVAGANGISGKHMVRVLEKHPERWSKIYTMSRREPMGKKTKETKHIASDFTKSPQEIAQALKAGGVEKVDYVFFFAYIPVEPEDPTKLWAAADELARVNHLILKNFLDALTIAKLIPKAVMLQCGLKRYSVHLGWVYTPQEETDPIYNLEANFYFPQWDELKAWCKANGSTWNVCFPSMILGAVPASSLNMMAGLALYASIQKALGRKLEFPGDIHAFEKLQCQSSAMLNAYIEEWAVLNPEADNQDFNIEDGVPFTWAKFWTKLAKFYGMEGTTPEVNGEYQVAAQPYPLGPRGFGQVAEFRYKFTLVDWAKTKEVRECYAKLAKEQGLDPKGIDDTANIFGLTDFALLMPWPAGMSMVKARKLGFTGNADSAEVMLNVIEELEELKVVPSVRK